MTHRRNVLVTGGASGIGRHLATVLGESGRWVVATDVDEKRLDEAAERMEWSVKGIETAVLDVSEVEDWRRVVDEIVGERGRIDLLIHCAGCLEPGYVFETKPEEIERQVDVNLKGTMFGTRIVGEVMVEQETGHIVNFGSLASLAPAPGISVYSGTKFGVRGFSLAASQELREHGVDVTVVMPDAVDTAMFRKEIDHPEAALTFSGGEPLEVEDIAEILLEHVLPDRPLEVALPTGRGGMARFANLVPGILDVLYPLFRKIGLRHQERFRREDQ